MNQKILVAIILIFLLSPTYSMSDDGGNVPVVQKENVSEEVTQVEQQSSSALEQSTKVQSHETVKDRLGVDTGMLKSEFDNFKNDYEKKFIKLFPNFRENAYKWYFNQKINLNRLFDFEKQGLNLRNFTVAQGSDYRENAVMSDIIVTGKVVELITKGEDYPPRYKFEIKEIIHGSEIIEKFLGETPKYMYFLAILGVSSYNESMLEKKGIYFFYVDAEIIKQSLFLIRPYSTVALYNDSIVCYERDFHKFDSAFKYKHGKLELSKMQKDNNYGERYLRWYDECEIGSWDEVIKNIRKIMEINDDKNFYRRSYSSEEE